MKSTEWIKILEAEVEKRFDKNQVDGFENSAPSIKYGILCDMYEEEPLDIEIGKEIAYDKLANEYETMSAWN